MNFSMIKSDNIANDFEYSYNNSVLRNETLNFVVRRDYTDMSCCLLLATKDGIILSSDKRDTRFSMADGEPSLDRYEPGYEKIVKVPDRDIIVMASGLNQFGYQNLTDIVGQLNCKSAEEAGWKLTEITKPYVNQTGDNTQHFNAFCIGFDKNDNIEIWLVVVDRELSSVKPFDIPWLPYATALGKSWARYYIEELALTDATTLADADKFAKDTILFVSNLDSKTRINGIGDGCDVAIIRPHHRMHIKRDVHTDG